jgi:hypothetical protein
MTTATGTALHPRASLYGAVFGRAEPPWVHSIGRTVAEASIVVTAVLAYFGVRGLTEGDPATAQNNARRVVAIEQFLRIDFEVPLQHLVVDHPGVTRLLNWIYIFGHWPVIATTLVWLLVRHRDVFTRVRNAILISGAVGLVIFATFPVAPPRLANAALVDTVTRQSSAYRVLQPPGFTNQYAAMPSLHVGWNLLITTAVLAATSRIWLRVTALALTFARDAAVVLTANHYIVDGLVGAALATLAWRLAARPRKQRNLTRPPANSSANSHRIEV